MIVSRYIVTDRLIIRPFVKGDEEDLLDTLSIYINTYQIHQHEDTYIYFGALRLSQRS